MSLNASKGPQRLVCLTEETTETLYLLGEETRIAASSAAKGRIIANPEEVIKRAPDIIIGSWCGKRFNPRQVCERRGWGAVPAVRGGDLYEIKSCDILQPGPAALTDGLRQLHAIVRRWAEDR